MAYLNPNQQLTPTPPPMPPGATATASVAPPLPGMPPGAPPYNPSLPGGGTPNPPPMPPPSLPTPPMPGGPPEAPAPGTPGTSPGAGGAEDAQHFFNTVDSSISIPQWQAWLDQGLYLGGGMWRSTKTCNGAPCPPVAEKPDNCPQGWYAHGIDSCRQGTPGGGGGPGGGGPGGGPGGGGPGGGPGIGEVGGEVWQAILRRLQGDSRFNPQNMGILLGAVKSQAESSARQQSQEANEDLAVRGLARSGIAARQQRGIRAGVGAQVLQARAQIERAKIDADFQDRTEAINEGLQYLGQLRAQLTSMYATDAQREAARANILLAEQNLAQQLSMFREAHAQAIQRAMLGVQ